MKIPILFACLFLFAVAAAAENRTFIIPSSELSDSESAQRQRMWGPGQPILKVFQRKLESALLTILYETRQKSPETIRFGSAEEWGRTEGGRKALKELIDKGKWYAYTSGSDGKIYARYDDGGAFVGGRIARETATRDDIDQAIFRIALEKTHSEKKTEIHPEVMKAVKSVDLGGKPKKPDSFQPSKVLQELSAKGEFETTAEHKARQEAWEGPYSTPITVTTYNADLGAYETVFRGGTFLVRIDRERAKEIATRKDSLRLDARLKYRDLNYFRLEDVAVTDTLTGEHYPLVHESEKMALTKVSAPAVYIPKAATQAPVENIRSIPDFKVRPREKDLAIVIGIEQYKRVPRSEYSKSDAGLVKDYLKALGFPERNIEFITDSDVTKSAIEKAVEAWLPNRVKPESRVILYYSGHGAPDPASGAAYLVPFDGDPNYLSVTGYPLKRLYDQLGRLPAREMIVLLDSCFSGAGGRSVLAKGARPLVMVKSSSPYFRNMAVLSAAGSAQISTSSPEKGHGLFTYHFLKALKDGGRDLAEIYERIRPAVEDDAKALNVQQSPVLQPDPGRIRGKFSFE
ncbi:MAG: caspase family protein [Deltaproteobacteria bacterium]|nr:caspase family protein [Deltaproteobacteria bacterium]